MKLWLARHAQPLVASGVCYGALNVAADEQATRVAARALADVLPTGVQLLSSPLQRCEQLAQCLLGLRPDLACKTDARLAEMDFGSWEGVAWDAVPRRELDGWTQSFASWRCGGAENLQTFMARVAAVWDETVQRNQPTVWITHAGVIRATTLLAQRVRQIKQADQWPLEAPAWGQWRVLAV